MFVIRAAGRPATEILAELRRRLNNTPADEKVEATTQLREIALTRLETVLADGSGARSDIARNNDGGDADITVLEGAHVVTVDGSGSEFAGGHVSSPATGSPPSARVPPPPASPGPAGSMRAGA